MSSVIVVDDATREALDAIALSPHSGYGPLPTPGDVVALLVAERMSPVAQPVAQPVASDGVAMRLDALETTLRSLGSDLSAMRSDIAVVVEGQAEARARERRLIDAAAGQPSFAMAGRIRAGLV
jgi:hypothetical protein